MLLLYDEIIMARTYVIASMCGMFLVGCCVAKAQWVHDRWLISGETRTFDGVTSRIWPINTATALSTVVCRTLAGDASLLSRGIYSATLRWSRPETLPPSFVVVRVQSSVSVSGNRYSNYGAATLGVDSGLGGVVEHREHGVEHSLHQLGVGFQRLPVDGIFATWQPVRGLVAGSNAQFLDGSMAISYEVLPPLWIEAEILEPNYREEAWQPVANARDRDMRITVDVALRQQEGTWVFGSWPVLSELLVSRPRLHSWMQWLESPQYSWSWSGDGEIELRSVDWPDLGIYAEFPQIEAGAVRADASTTFTLTLSDEGSDFPPTSADYRVRWHLPYEDWTELRPDTRIEEELDLEVHAPGHAVPGASVGLTVYKTSPYLRLVEPVESLIGSGSAAISNPLYKGLFGTLVALASRALDSQMFTYYASFSDMWNAHRSTFDPDKNVDRYDYYKAVPVMWVGKLKSFREGKGYSTRGFIGRELRSVEYLDGSEGVYGHLSDPERRRGSAGFGSGSGGSGGSGG